MKKRKKRSTEPKSAPEWFQKAVFEKRIDPLNLDLTKCPENILGQLTCEMTPDGEEVPTQEAIETALYLFLKCRDEEIKRKTGRPPKKIVVDSREFYDAVISLVIMATMEKLSRKGLLKWHSEGRWYDASGQLFVSDFKPYPPDPQLLESLNIWM